MKGISPLVAVVLLIAFTVAVGGILGLFVTQFTTTQTGLAGGGSSKLIKCTASQLDITAADFAVTGAAPDYVNVTVEYETGQEDLYTFKIEVISSGEVSIFNSTQFNKTAPMKPGQTFRWAINTSSLAPSGLFQEIGDADIADVKAIRVRAFCQDDFPVFVEESCSVTGESGTCV